MNRKALLPPFLRALLLMLKDDGVDWEGVSSLIVLRIISPAIISPDRFRLIDHGLLPAQVCGFACFPLISDGRVRSVAVC
jgi:hypothetical protein